MICQNDNDRIENINYWKIPKEHRSQIKLAYDNLMAIYEPALIHDPYNLANAISSLDCLSEQQEENWQTWDIKKCKNDFLKAMHQIYNKIEAANEEIKIDEGRGTETIKNEENSKNISNSDSVSVVTKKEEEILQIIYFDFDKFNIRPDAAVELDKIVEVLRDYPDMVIELGSHTDCRGSDEYNLSLSSRRAESSAAYVQERIDNADRIYGKGFGETTPNIPSPDGCRTLSEEEHQLNRRTEFIIVELGGARTRD